MLASSAMTSALASLSGELVQWLHEHDCLPSSLAPLAGDVSVRQYSRLSRRSGETLILARYPPELLGACQRFITTTRLLGEIGIAVPPIVAQDCTRGFMLVGDCGTATLYDFESAPWPSLTPYFETAVELALRIRELPAGSVAELNPPLDRALLERELDQTLSEFLRPQGFCSDTAEARLLEQVLAELCTRLAELPMAACHRDFMARNLVPSPSPPERASLEAATLWVLDHQDLRLGPPHYDVASLLNDSLFPPPEIERALLGRALGDRDDRLPYHRAAAQRTLKALGTFARFARRGEGRHLRLVPGTLRRALSHLEVVPEAGPVRAGLRRHAERLLLHWKPS